MLFYQFFDSVTSLSFLPEELVDGNFIFEYFAKAYLIFLVTKLCHVFDNILSLLYMGTALRNTEHIVKIAFFPRIEVNVDAPKSFLSYLRDKLVPILLVPVILLYGYIECTAFGK